MNDKPWPKCRNCGQDLILAHVRIGYCNEICELAAHYKAEQEAREKC